MASQVTNVSNIFKSREPMATNTDQRAVARLPTKAPSRLRFQGILDEAERLILEHGLGGFSIPVLAERLGYTRASIYFFFPTPNAVLNELSRRYFQESGAQIMEFARARDLLSWRDLLEQVLTFTANYYNKRPVARILLLGGAIADQNNLVAEETNQQLGELFRILFQMRGVNLPKKPDVAWILMDIVDAVLRHSQHRYRRITEECRDEALRAATAYVSLYADAPGQSRKIRRRK
jgi:AcrR family transcriptional regulator